MVASKSRDDEFQRLRNAQLYDLTQPYIVDKTPIIEHVAQWLNQHVPAPRILELGCGTGLFAEPLLSRLQDGHYLGIDRSAEMIGTFRAKIQGTPLNERVELRDGIDLRSASAYDSLRSFRCNVILSSQFLQYLPLAKPADQAADDLDRAGLLGLLKSLLPDDGVIFLFEDLLGEDDEETRQYGRAWDDYVINQYRSHPELMEQIEAIDTNFVRAIRRGMDNPNLMALIRQRRRSARGEMPAALSTYQDLFAAMGFSVESERHPELQNFVLFRLTPLSS